MSILTQADFATIKTVCSTVGLIIFGGVFMVATAWVFRPSAKKYYQTQATKVLEQ